MSFLNLNLFAENSISNITCGEIMRGTLNPLTTNDAYMRHDHCELSITLWEFIWSIINTRRYTLVQGFSLFWLFLMEGKGSDNVNKKMENRDACLTPLCIKPFREIVTALWTTFLHASQTGIKAYVTRSLSTSVSVRCPKNIPGRPGARAAGG